MNDSTPLAAAGYEITTWPRRHQKVDFVLGSGEHGNRSLNSDLELAAPAAGAANRWQNDLGPFYPAASDLEFIETEWKVRPRDASTLSTRVLKRALQVAVMANGGALVALAFTVQSVDSSSGAGVAAALVLGLGLLSAAISFLAYLNFELADASWRAARRRIAPSSWLAAISGAGSYAAFCLAAFWLLPVVIGL